MQGLEELFGLLAELAIALAGFAGVAAAFAGRDRSYRPLEGRRLLALFINSGAVLVGCGVVHTLLLAGTPARTTLRLASLATALVIAGIGVPSMLRVLRYAREPGAMTEDWAMHLTSAYMVLTLSLLATNAMLGSAPLLVGVLWLLLVYGLWMFSRLLTRTD